MAFLGYTIQQAAAIHQALVKEHLKPDADWPHLLKLITDKMYEVTSPETANQEIVYAGDVKSRLKKLVKALNDTVQAHKELGEVLQWSLDDQLLNVPLVRDGYSDEWRTTVRCLLSSDQFPLALNAMRQAADLAAAQHRSGPTTGAPKNYVIRWAVRELLHIFESATGIPPTVYATPHTKAGYGGNFYPFAVASLTPWRLVPAKTLGSNILTAYKEWHGHEKHQPNFPTQQK